MFVTEDPEEGWDGTFRGQPCKLDSYVWKVVVTKSTVPVGTARKVRAAIEAHSDHEVHVCSNPEFLKEGAAVDDFMKPDRVVAGVDSEYARYVFIHEFAHHFGPSSRTAYKSLRALDRRIKEIFKIINRIPGRPYDVYILSDHGQTPSVPYRVRYGETLGDTVNSAAEHGVLVMARTGEYAPSDQAVDFLVRELEGVAGTSSLPARKAGLGFSRWLRKHYKIFPLTAEVVRPLEEHRLVLTYSSSLAHVYWTEPDRPLRFEEIRDDPAQRALYYFLVAHDGIGVVLTRMLDGVHAESRRGRCLVTAEAEVEVLEGEDPLADYAPGSVERKALLHLVHLENAGDLVLFGAYDPATDLQICFDDQVGAHGALGGRQFWPFLLTAPGLVPEMHPIRDPLDLHPLFARYPILGREKEAPGRDMAWAGKPGGEAAEG